MDIGDLQTAEFIEEVTNRNVIEWLNKRSKGIPGIVRHPIVNGASFSWYNSVLYGDTPKATIDVYNKIAGRFWIAHPRLRIKYDRWVKEDRLLRYMYLVDPISFADQIRALHDKGHYICWTCDNLPGGQVAPSSRHILLSEWVSKVSGLSMSEIRECSPYFRNQLSHNSSFTPATFTKYVPGVSFVLKPEHPCVLTVAPKAHVDFVTYTKASLTAKYAERQEMRKLNAV